NSGTSWQSFPPTIFDKDTTWCFVEGRFATHDSLPNALVLQYVAKPPAISPITDAVGDTIGYDTVMCGSSIARVDISHDKGSSWKNLIAKEDNSKIELAFSPTDTSFLYLGKVSLWRYGRDTTGGIRGKRRI